MERPRCYYCCCHVGHLAWRVWRYLGMKYVCLRCGDTHDFKKRYPKKHPERV